MSGEARRWLQYAWENRQIAQISLERGFFNPCLQNAQQAVEKALKALWIAEGLPLKKTHSIQELTGDWGPEGSMWSWRMMTVSCWTRYIFHPSTRWDRLYRISSRMKL